MMRPSCDERASPSRSGMRSGLYERPSLLSGAKRRRRTRPAHHSTQSALRRRAGGFRGVGGVFGDERRRAAPAPAPRAARAPGRSARRASAAAARSRRCAARRAGCPRRGSAAAARRHGTAPRTSFSPGRRPMNAIFTSLSGFRPASRIICRARSTILIGSPMSSTKILPRSAPRRGPAPRPAAPARPPRARS